MIISSKICQDRLGTTRKEGGDFLKHRDRFSRSFTAFQAEADFATDPAIAAYVKELEASKLGLIEMATTYGYDESDKLDEMEATFAGEKFCELIFLSSITTIIIVVIKRC